MTRVALLWHMHQPFYQDLITGEHILPWVRLHATKDYWGMVALLREFPQVKVTFNLVPSLLVQLDAFAQDVAKDRHLELGLKPADSLSDDERAYCVEHFFHAHQRTMIEPYPRYAELLARRNATRGASIASVAQAFATEDIRDLQMWHKLVWIDPFYVSSDERVRHLIAKGRGFAEDDKRVLRDVELELLRRVVPEYRQAAERGQVELSTSPFFHPILPLLCDSDVYLRTHPHSRMPREPFRHPEDALEQLQRAVALHEQLFGKRPRGVWPSEGSVSDAMVPLVTKAGFEWMATDEEILARTLQRGFSRDSRGHVEQPEVLYRPYRVGMKETVACGFRDHTLSDLIGFTYAGWSADAASHDFVERLREAGARYTAKTGGKEATIFVILDGENAWEHYEGQGRPFLRALYHRLGSTADLQTVTMAEACSQASERLPSVFPGSWINGDFYIWIGHADDHRAWSQLVDARRALAQAPATTPEASLARAREEMLIAEGSDWFWWYGDDHSSDHDLEFDDLFRRHVRNVYRALDQPIPEELLVTNISTRPPEVEILTPSGLISPSLDGEVTSYFEWMGAGSLEVAPTIGAMHQVTERHPGISSIEFGFDYQHLYIRIDTASATMTELLAGGAELGIKFLTPPGVRVAIQARNGRAHAALRRRTEVTDRFERDESGVAVTVNRIAEVRVPFASLGLTRREPFAFLVSLSRNGTEVEHHPAHRAIELTVPDEQFLSANWTV